MDDTTTILVPRRNIPEALFALLFQVPSTWILIASTLRVWTPSGEGKVDSFLHFLRPEARSFSYLKWHVSTSPSPRFSPRSASSPISMLRLFLQSTMLTSTPW